MANAVRVEGLAELERAFFIADRELQRDLRDALAESAAPVRSDAQSLAGSGVISHLKAGKDWTKMRIGVSRSIAYVAPVERGAKSRGRVQYRRGRNYVKQHPFDELLVGKAMEPALERNIHNVERRFDHMLDDVFRVWERV